jgi:hypothetical protein
MEKEVYSDTRVLLVIVRIRGKDCPFGKLHCD